jgi:ankyrin repeat protein
LREKGEKPDQLPLQPAKDTSARTFRMVPLLGSDVMMEYARQLWSWIEGGRVGSPPLVPNALLSESGNLTPLKGPEEQYEILRKVKEVEVSGDPRLADNLRDYYVDVPDIVLAARVGYGAKVRELLDLGVDPNLRSKAGTTALMESLVRGDEETARLLLDRNADINATSNFGGTPLHCAVNRCSADVVALLLTMGADIDARNQDGLTALMMAAQAGRSEVVRMLLERGADPSPKDNMGGTALTYAAEGGQDESGGDYRCVKLLLDAGADPNVMDNQGQTPLMSAAFYNDVESVRALIERGADVNARNSRGHTALLSARSAGNSDIIELLIQAGALDDPPAIPEAGSRR